MDAPSSTSVFTVSTKPSRATTCSGAQPSYSAINQSIKHCRQSTQACIHWRLPRSTHTHTHTPFGPHSHPRDSPQGCARRYYHHADSKCTAASHRPVGTWHPQALCFQPGSQHERMSTCECGTSSRWSTAAPAATSSLTTSSWQDWHARWSGVQPS